MRTASAIYNMKKNINDSMNINIEEALNQEAISTVYAIRVRSKDFS